MNPSYDKIASSYDFLSRLVFGKAQVKAQINQLIYLEDCEHILVVGGGTGWILEEIFKINNVAKITFVEHSAEMLKLARQVGCENKVDFVQGDAEFFNAEHLFDAILTPFLFDNFDERKAKAVFENLGKLLKKDGLWLYVDFKPNGKLWKRSLLKAMQIFFRLIGAINTKQFVETDKHFQNGNYTVLEKKLYYWGFIEAKVYIKDLMLHSER